MGFSCAICSDSLEKFYNPDNKPGEPKVVIPNNVNIMTTPCGHVYHAYCIMRWISGGVSNSATCPNCRKIISAKQCVPLFHDSYDFSLLDSSGCNLAGDPTGIEAAQNAALQLRLNALTKQCDERDIRFNDLNETLIAVSNENSTLLDDLSRERIKSESYLVKYQEAKSYKSYAEQKEKQCMKLQEDLTKFSYVKTMLDGVKVDLEHDIKNFPLSMTSIKSLVEMKHLLQQQIETMKHKAQSEQGEKESHRRELLKLESKIAKLKTEKDELKLVINSGCSKNLAKSQGIKISNTKGSTTSTALKRANSDDLERTITLSDSGEDGQENKDAEDVGYFTGLTDVKSNARASKNIVTRTAKVSKKQVTEAETDCSSERLTRLKSKSSIPGLGITGVTGKKIVSNAAATSTLKFPSSSSFRTMKTGWKN